MTRRRPGDQVPTEPIPPETLAEVVQVYAKAWTMEWIIKQTFVYPWGRLAALAQGDRFDVVAVYNDGPRGAVRTRRFRTGAHSFAHTFGTVAIGDVVEIAAAVERWGPRFARVLEEAEAKLHQQLCCVCGARCYAKQLGLAPQRRDDGRCQRCAEAGAAHPA